MFKIINMNERAQMIFEVLKGNFDLVHKKEACKTILELLGDESLSNGNINFYPSNKKDACYSEAIFVSITSSPNKVKLDNNQLIPLNDILPILFKQTLIDCLNINKNVVLLTDNIETKEFQKWKNHFKLLKELNINIDIFYIGGDKLIDLNDIVL